MQRPPGAVGHLEGEHLERRHHEEDDSDPQIQRGTRMGVFVRGDLGVHADHLIR